MNMRLLGTAVPAFWLAAAVGLAGCGGAGMTSAVPQETMAAAYDAYENAAPEAALTGGDRGSGVYFGEAAKSGEWTDEDSAAEEAVADSAELPAGRKLIRTVDMHVETDGFDDLLSRITDHIRELGGYVETSDISGRRASYQNEPAPRNAFLTARIPSAKLDLFITSVEEQGNVVNKSENTQDVTLQYSDLESRKKSLSIEQDRIWALLEKADTLEAVIALEERLSEIRYQLESMESQLRLYDNQVDYSTVTIRIQEVTTFTPTAPESLGQRIGTSFSKNMRSVSQFFTTLFIVLISGIPIWGPILIILLLILFLIRRRRRRMGKDSYCGRISDKATASTGKNDGAQPPKTF